MTIDLFVFLGFLLVVNATVWFFISHPSKDAISLSKELDDLRDRFDHALKYRDMYFDVKDELDRLKLKIADLEK